MRSLLAAAVVCLLVACSGHSPGGNGSSVETSSENTVVPAVPRNLPKPDLTASADPVAAVEPIPPGQPGGLPDDRTPVSEAPFTPDSPQGAADVVQRYFALIGEHKYADAYALWSGAGQNSGQTADAFATSLKAYRQYDAQVGAPGRIEGAAGSRYVTVPVQVYGRDADSKPFHRSGRVTLRRVGEIDGATAEQKRWHIESMDLKPQG